MELTVTLAGGAYRVDLDRPMSLAIPLRFDGPQPSFFGAPAASAQAWRDGDFIGDTGAGGGCNVARISLVPHCNGTHTETAGHVLDAATPLHDALSQSVMAALLVSVAATPGDGGQVISRAALSAALAQVPAVEAPALVVRTLPNDPGKRAMVYRGDRPPPFFEGDAMRLMVERGVRHLLVDLPSIDPMHDEGRLANHRIFWNLPPGGHAAGPAARLDCTVTEMIFVADAIADGLYLLNLQAPSFASDAAPSRPVLYRLSGVAP